MRVSWRRTQALLCTTVTNEPEEQGPSLDRHLTRWLGAWPPRTNGVTIVPNADRSAPGWDGKIHDIIGVATPNAAVLSVPVALAERLAEVVRGDAMDTDLALLNAAMPAIVGRPGRVAGGIFRWSLSPTPGPDVGEWVPTHDPRVPAWLKPFNGDVLVAWNDEGRYGAGVGRKMHNEFGHELSVVTEEALRGRGIGRALVETAARLVLAQGKVPTYLHQPTNHASARLAEAAGFPDVGWRVLFFGPEPTN